MSSILNLCYNEKIECLVSSSHKSNLYLRVKKGLGCSSWLIVDYRTTDI